MLTTRGRFYFYGTTCLVPNSHPLCIPIRGASIHTAMFGGRALEKDVIKVSTLSLLGNVIFLVSPLVVVSVIGIIFFLF